MNCGEQTWSYMLHIALHPRWSEAFVESRICAGQCLLQNNHIKWKHNASATFALAFKHIIGGPCLLG